jgi:mono/diheme cytochrome c family protein
VKTSTVWRGLALGVGASLLIVGLILRAEEKFVLPPETATFRPGPGAELALGQCLICHSADYVSTQPRLARPAWKATVLKMRDKYGAPLAEDKIDALVDYLVKTYGAAGAAASN